MKTFKNCFLVIFFLMTVAFVVNLSLALEGGDREEAMEESTADYEASQDEDIQADQGQAPPDQDYEADRGSKEDELEVKNAGQEAASDEDLEADKGDTDF